MHEPIHYLLDVDNEMICYDMFQKKNNINIISVIFIHGLHIISEANYM